MAKEKNRVCERYRTCFTTDAGRYVFADMLLHSGFFDTDLQTEGEIAVLNFVKTIIKNMGIGNTDTSISEFVNKIMEMRADG